MSVLTYATRFLMKNFFEAKEENEGYEAPKLAEIPKPHEIKSYLDQHIVGQDDAKRSLQ